MCDYCEDRKSIISNADESQPVQEVYIEPEGKLIVNCNTWDPEGAKKDMSIGFSFYQAALMNLHTYREKIRYCPFCGKQFKY